MPARAAATCPLAGRHKNILLGARTQQNQIEHAQEVLLRIGMSGVLAGNGVLLSAQVSTCATKNSAWLVVGAGTLAMVEGGAQDGGLCRRARHPGTLACEAVAVGRTLA